MTSPNVPRHIVYVDDDPDMRLLVKSVLENTGNMRVTACANAVEILEAAIESKPDMIILDVVMPLMNGKEIFNEIRNNKRIGHTPIIFLTSLSREQDRKALMALGAVGVITKPFDLTTLAAQISDLWKSGSTSS